MLSSLRCFTGAQASTSINLRKEMLISGMRDVWLVHLEQKGVSVSNCLTFHCPQGSRLLDFSLILLWMCLTNITLPAFSMVAKLCVFNVLCVPDWFECVIVTATAAVWRIKMASVHLSAETKRLSACAEGQNSFPPYISGRLKRCFLFT